MLSTLPLLFVDGHFTSIDEMKDEQMEKFISFLVRCSNTEDNNTENNDTIIQEPPWWLADLPFVYPVRHPKKTTRKWRHKLKSLIKLCYKYHRYELLMEMSRDLAEQQKLNNLRFIQKCKHTTAIYNKSEHKIIATIRNENMTYDLEYNSNLCRLQRDDFENMISPKTSNICSTNCPIIDNYLKTKDCQSITVTCDDHVSQTQTQNEFLQYFQLASKDDNSSSMIVVNSSREYVSRIKFTNTPYIPFSSQLGRRLAAKVKYFVQDQTHLKRLDRINRYLNGTSLIAPAVPNQITGCAVRQKFSQQWVHTYKFPGKTYQSHKNTCLKTAILLSKCKSCYVKMTPLNVENSIILFEDNNSSNSSGPPQINEIIDLTTSGSEFSFDVSPSDKSSTQIIDLSCSNNSSSSTVQSDEVGDSHNSTSTISRRTELARGINSHKKRKKNESRNKMQKNTLRNKLWRGLVTIRPPKVRLSERLNKKYSLRKKNS